MWRCITLRNYNIKKRNCNSGSDDLEIEEAWQKYLEDHLQFPFEAEVVDDPGPLKVAT